MYGLRSAPSAWWHTLTRVLTELGFTQLIQDRAVYTLIQNERCHGVVAVHVDDLSRLSPGKALRHDCYRESTDRHIPSRRD